MLPDDPGKIIKFVLLIIPGFIALGFAEYLTAFELEEFKFGFLAVAISLVIYYLSEALSNLAYRFVLAVLSLFRYGIWDPNLSAPMCLGPVIRAPVPLFASVVLVMSLVTSVLVAKVYQHDIALGLPRMIGIEFDRESRLPPSKLVLTKDVTVLDARPEHLRGDKFWLRIFLPSDQTYEGFPRYYPTAGESFEFFLSPACKAKHTAGSSVFTAIEGPGVLILEKDINRIELIDESQSDCCKLYFNVEPYKCGRSASGGR